MKKMALPLAVAFFLATMGTLLHADNFQHQAGGVTIWLPDDWEIDSDEEEGAIYADAPEGDAYCVLQVLHEIHDLDAALKIYTDILSEEMDNFSATQKERPDTLNGMEIMRINGIGLRDEETWSVNVLLIAAKKAVLMCAMGWEKDPNGNFASLREKIFPSIRALN